MVAERTIQLKRAQARVGKHYNKDRYPVPYKVGQKVVYKILQISDKAAGIAGKLNFRWSEPVTISKFLSDVTVELVDAKSGLPLRRAHVSQLKPCPIEVSPLG